MKNSFFGRNKFKYSGIRVKIWVVLKKSVMVLLCSLGLALLYHFVFSLFFDTPREKAMKRENDLLSSEYSRLTEQIRGLDTVVKELRGRDRSIYATLLQSQPLEFDYDSYFLPRYQLWARDSCFGLVSYLDGRYKQLHHRATEITRAFGALTRRLQQRRDSVSGIPSCFPLLSPDFSAIGASVGPRMHPFYKVMHNHKGMDLLAGLGTNVFATAEGKVTKVRRSKKGDGNTVVIKHPGYGFETRYAHLGDILVRQGQQVNRSTVIARVGNTGMSLLPHLHYEILKDGQIMDPVHYFFADLHPAAYQKIVQISHNTGQSLD